ncbi:unnamed protein product [Lactuca virosa]|uniref:Cysteine-rich receptor-like protein kinase 2 n=1 Tax=Lactuca virosa TaxID=75947 RepID=A0AAU9N5D3_9ASTR|nr:unnamed protein product [Lactuca virosa]
MIQLSCNNQTENNPILFSSNFIQTTESIGTQVQSSLLGTANSGTGPDGNFGLSQCYGDLSTSDCIICYDSAHYLVSRCFPYTGARVYLDGCFMRFQNFSFFDEYSGPSDTSVCGNTTRKSSLFQDSCLPWSEGRALNTGCFMRYSDVNFLNPVASRSSNRGRIIAIVTASVSSILILLVALLIGLYIWRRRVIEKKRTGSYDAKKLAKILTDSSLNFKYSTIEKATGNWNDSNKLGQGGFGIVYKGVLPDGREIAVKRLFFNNKFRAADFYNEVNMISSVEHKNLVRLLGCSCSGPESFLVYEFLPNMSLDHFIFDAIKGKELNWEKRLRAKIADFGLARSFQQDLTHISTAIAGTLGYMAPEYLAFGQLTEKADVYSYGVLLLEVVTGMQNNRSKDSEDSDSLVSIAWTHFQQGTVEEILDPNLMFNNTYPKHSFKKEAVKVVHVGLLCTQEAPSLRPSISMALKMLVKDDEPLPTPSNPPFIDRNEFNELEEKLQRYHDDDDLGSVATVSHSRFLPR